MPPEPESARDWTHGRADVGEVDLHYVAAGPEHGELVVLLHGFPEFWYAWRAQLPALAEAGYRVVAPDMRGYNRSEKPAGVSAYRVGALVDDVCGLIETQGAERAHLVGHDWGAAVAWQVGIDRPDVLESLSILNGPHPSAYERALRSSTEQLRRSWYVFAVQLPLLPEWYLRRNRAAAVAKLLRGGTVQTDAFSGTELRRYREAFSTDGVATAALNYYRAAFRDGVRTTLFEGGVGDQRVGVETLVLWGEQDPALSTALLDLEPWVPELTIQRFPDVGHFVQSEAPQQTTEALAAFLASR